MRYLLVCSLLVGCSFQPAAAGLDAGLDATGPTDAGSSLTPQSFIEQLLAEECEQAFACKPQYLPAGNTFDDEWGTDLNDCVTTDRDYVARDAIAAAVTAGTITFDPAIAATCLAAPGIPATCSTLFADNYDWADSCYVALAGHVADGAACTTSWECVRTLHCIGARCSP